MKNVFTIFVMVLISCSCTKDIKVNNCTTIDEDGLYKWGLAEERMWTFGSGNYYHPESFVYVKQEFYHLTVKLIK